MTTPHNEALLRAFYRRYRHVACPLICRNSYDELGVYCKAKGQNSLRLAFIAKQKGQNSLKAKGVRKEGKYVPVFEKKIRAGMRSYSSSSSKDVGNISTYCIPGVSRLRSFKVL